MTLATPNVPVPAAFVAYVQNGYPAAARGFISPDWSRTIIRYAVREDRHPENLPWLDSLSHVRPPIPNWVVLTPDCSIIGNDRIKVNAFIVDLKDALPRLLAPGIAGGATGGAVVSLEGNAAVEADIIDADVITIPISLAILAWVLRSGRLVLITVVCLIGSICGAFALILPLTVVAPVPSWTVRPPASSLPRLALSQALSICRAFVSAQPP